MTPFISICIPAFKSVDYLKRLLDSISLQSYRDFEVVVTDDSPDLSVNELCDQYRDKFILQYFRNNKPLGTPENWNESIRRSAGAWIKMMHDDDWFAETTSLAEFAGAAKAHDNATFIFSGFYNVHDRSDKKERFIIEAADLKRLKRSPLYLFRRNFIGHPSTTLIRNDNQLSYDQHLKWVVDFEFYMRYLNHHNGLLAIKKPLINIGIHELQVTKQSFRNPVVEIPEVIYLYHKLPPHSFKHVFVYDYYWRCMRNLGIRTVADLKEYAGNQAAPSIMVRIINFQRRFPLALLRIGYLSKPLMFISYLTNYRSL